MGDMTLAITVGSEKEPVARHATLKVTLVIEGQADSWNLMTEGVRLIVNASAETLRPASSTLRIDQLLSSPGLNIRRPGFVVPTHLRCIGVAIPG